MCVYSPSVQKARSQKRTPTNGKQELLLVAWLLLCAFYNALPESLWCVLGGGVVVLASVDAVFYFRFLCPYFGGGVGVFFLLYVLGMMKKAAAASSCVARGCMAWNRNTDNTKETIGGALLVPTTLITHRFTRSGGGGCRWAAALILAPSPAAPAAATRRERVPGSRIQP